MIKEVLEHCARTVLRHMDGNIKEFERLTSLVMRMNHQCIHRNCGEQKELEKCAS